MPRSTSLSHLFREHAPTDVRTSEAGTEDALRRLLDEGRHAWPTLDLSPEAFLRHLASRHVTDEPLADLRAADLYLACACAERVRGAIEAFERAHMSRVGVLLARMRPSAAFVDDVRQTLREKLFVGKDGARPKIAEYTGRGALESWVRVIALRAAIDLRRQGAEAVDEGGAKPDDGRPPSAELEVDPELDYIKKRYRRDFNKAIRQAVTALTKEQRELLQLHFVDGLTLDQLAATLGVHRATVARRIAAARKAIVDEAHRLLRAWLRASESELDSLAGVMKSQIDLTLAGLLKGTS
jgi:RNA polymerase sigma-70 factor, ECF subfamily